MMGLGRKGQKPKKEKAYPECVGGETSGGARGRQTRNAIVQKVMREKGLKLIEASKYVKAQNLY